MLATRLLSDVPNRETINSNQQAIKELSQKEDFCLELETLGQLIEQSVRKQDDEIIETFIKLAENQPPALPIFWKVLMLSLIHIYVDFHPELSHNITAIQRQKFLCLLLDQIKEGDNHQAVTEEARVNFDADTLLQGDVTGAVPTDTTLFLSRPAHINTKVCRQRTAGLTLRLILMKSIYPFFH